MIGFRNIQRNLDIKMIKVLNRNYKFRLYPDKNQEEILRSYEGILRFLWNICHKQRMLALDGKYMPLLNIKKKEDEDKLNGISHKYVSLEEENKENITKIFMKDICKDFNLSQNKQMTELQEHHTWIAKVQCQARQNTLADLDKAWQRCFKKLGGKPRFKNKRDAMKIYIPNTVKSITSGDRKTGKINFASPSYKELGTLRAVFDRSIKGKIKSWSIKRENKDWFIIASVEKEFNIYSKTESENKTVGIDRGVILFTADSNGRTVVNPKFHEDTKLRLTRAQRELAKKKKGSSNRKKAIDKVARLYKLVARQRESFLHAESKYYADNYDVVVLEDLKIKNMTSSAKGTIEEPGKNVRQKAGLNKSIINAGWGKFAENLRYKLEEHGGTLKKVNSAYTSQQCCKCHYIDSANRKSQSEFVCVKCGHVENADVNAAKNIKEKGLTDEKVSAKVSHKMINRKRKSKVSG
jgi:putative transposase